MKSYGPHRYRHVARFWLRKSEKVITYNTDGYNMNNKNFKESKKWRKVAFIGSVYEYPESWLFAYLSKNSDDT